MRPSSSEHQDIILFLTEALLFLGFEHACHAVREITRPGRSWEGCQGLKIEAWSLAAFDTSRYNAIVLAFKNTEDRVQQVCVYSEYSTRHCSGDGDVSDVVLV